MGCGRALSFVGGASSSPERALFSTEGAFMFNERINGSIEFSRVIEPGCATWDSVARARADTTKQRYTTCVG